MTAADKGKRVRLPSLSGEEARALHAELLDMVDGRQLDPAAQSAMDKLLDALER